MRQSLGEFDEQDDGFALMGDERPDEYGPPDRRLPKVLLSVLAMGVFAGGLWFAYHLGARHPGVGVARDGVPLIHADLQPDKVKPEQPGGMQVPDQNVSIYNEKQGLGPVEKLLPPPEKPMPRPVPVAVPPAAPPMPADASANPPAPPFPAPTASPPAPPAAVPATHAAAPPPAPPAPAVRTATIEHAAPAYGAKPNGIQVRLGSLRSPEAARLEWHRLKHTNPDLLGNLSAVAVRTDLGEKGIYYRIEAGPFADAAAAEKLCSELKRRKLGCILAR